MVQEDFVWGYRRAKRHECDVNTMLSNDSISSITLYGTLLFCDNTLGSIVGRFVLSWSDVKSYHSVRIALDSINAEWDWRTSKLR
jgi:hypothetical protein